MPDGTRKMFSCLHFFFRYLSRVFESVGRFRARLCVQKNVAELRAVFLDSLHTKKEISFVF